MNLFWLGVCVGLGITTMGVIITYILLGPVKEKDKEELC